MSPLSSPPAQSVHFSSASDEWATPADLFAVLDREFHFTLDAAATEKNAKCARFFTKEDDSLGRDWGDTHTHTHTHGTIRRVA